MNLPASAIFWICIPAIPRIPDIWVNLEARSAWPAAMSLSRDDLDSDVAVLINLDAYAHGAPLADVFDKNLEY